MAAVERNGGVNREIRVILDPAEAPVAGPDRRQVNQQLSAQVNLNAAGGRAEIAGSEQSVRVLGNADTAYTLSQTQISVGGGRTVRLSDIADVRDLYAEQRSLSTVQRSPGAQLRLPARQGRVRRHRLQGRQGEAGGAGEAQSAGSVRPAVQLVEVHRAAISRRDRRDDRGRGARGHRRVPVPARLARDGHFRARHSAVGDPRLLVHGPDGLHAQPDDAARAQSGRGRAGRRRDRRDREYRAPHADGQIRLSGIDRRRRRDRPCRCWRRRCRSSRCSCPSG